MLELWQDLEAIADITYYPWVVGGYFNTILSDSKRIEGLPVTQAEIVDFANYVCSCSLNEFHLREAASHGGMKELNMNVFLKDLTESFVIVNSYQWFLIVKFIIW